MSFAVALLIIEGGEMAHNENAYPGSFRVLFIEYAKCLPSDVKSRGL
jgi:hypothetical protein